MRTEEEFKQALHEKKVPLLVLDQKWHRLFAIHGKTDEIKETEEELNGLLARQGKLNSEVKDLKKLKNTLMNNIMENMDDSISAFNSEILFLDSAKAFFILRRAFAAKKIINGI